MRVYRVIYREQWGVMSSRYYTSRELAEKELMCAKRYFSDPRIAWEEIDEKEEIA